MIVLFRGEYGFLSNFYKCPIAYKGHTFKCTESAFQSAKCVAPKQIEKLATMDGHDAKKAVRHMTTIPKEQWNEISINTMFEVNWIKYQDPILKEKLLATDGQILMEGNSWHDNFWGSCDCGRCKNGDPWEQTDKNYLGKTLMYIRFFLRYPHLKPDFVTKEMLDIFYAGMKSSLK